MAGMNIRGLPTPAQCKRDFLNAIVCGPIGQRVPYFEFAFGRQHLERLLGASEVRDGWPKGGPIPAMRVPPDWLARVALQTGIGFIAPGFIWEIGRVYERGADPNGNDVYAGGSVRSVADIKAAPPPPIDAAMARLDQFIRLARQNDLAAGFIVYGPLAIAQFAMGLEEFSLALYDDPDIVRALIDASVEVYVPLIHAAMNKGIDFLLISDALCFKNGPMFDPDAIRALWHPGIAPYLRAAKGVPVGLHSDGNNTVFLDDYINLGFRFLHPIEPCDGAFDIYETQRKIRGRLALAGNIDLAGVLARGTPDQVRADVQEHIRRLAPAGGYLCGSSHEISDAVPPENFHAMVQTIHEAPVMS